MTDLAEEARRRRESPILRRFGIEIVEENPQAATITSAMSLASMTNPFTGAATIGPLAILVDATSGVSNHFRRGADEWTVTSELAFDLSPGEWLLAAAELGVPVVSNAKPLGHKGRSSLSLCTLTCGDTVIGGGTVRSMYVHSDRVVDSAPSSETLIITPHTALSELMALQVENADDETPVLSQRVDPILYNEVGIVNGGVAAAALELAASAAINMGDEAFRTASLRVNFLRPFVVSERSRYVATPVRVGRGSAIGDAQAVNADGTVALTARVTAYR